MPDQVRYDNRELVKEKVSRFKVAVLYESLKKIMGTILRL